MASNLSKLCSQLDLSDDEDLGKDIASEKLKIDTNLKKQRSDLIVKAASKQN